MCLVIWFPQPHWFCLVIHSIHVNIKDLGTTTPSIPSFRPYG